MEANHRLQRVQLTQQTAFCKNYLEFGFHSSFFFSIFEEGKIFIAD